MSKLVRFLVHVDSSWNVLAKCLQDDSWRRQGSMRKLLAGSGRFFPAPAVRLHDPDASHDGLAGEEEAGNIQALYESILRKEKAQVERFGHYLFDALIGRELWAEMQQKAEALGGKTLDLALCWSDSDLDLHRLNWEMMRSDDAFLVAGTSKLGVAITRIVDVEALQGAPQLNVPPRVLFVIGTGLHEREIRPGAELLGLLRRIQADRAIHHRLLERATPNMVRNAIKAFSPDIVHYICHGGVDPESGRVYLDLRSDNEEVGTNRYAEQLLFDLKAGGSLPTIVVLSACFTAGTQGAERYVLAGGHETAPLAATLVRQGIPIVVAMSGRVADMTCRLFARRFGHALIDGEPLVLATAQARQAAFATGRDPVTTPDWAFPTVFLARNVPCDYTPIDKLPSDNLWTKVEQWITAYNLRWDPVFCGREIFLRKFLQLFEVPGVDVESEEGKSDEGKKVLAAYTDRPDPGYGRTRLLMELAINALRDGHIPVMLTFDATEDTPKTLDTFANEMARAISSVRGYLGLGESPTSQLDEVASPDIDITRQRPVQLDEAIWAELRRAQGAPTPRALSLAIQRDLGTLLDDATREIPYFRMSRAQIVVLLDNIEQYGSSLISRLVAKTGGILNASGFGTPENPIPAVVTFSLGSVTDGTLRPLTETNKIIRWLTTERLGPFEPNGEDILACELVLLYPFVPDLSKGISDTAWAFNDQVADAIREKWEERFRKQLKGIPVKLGSDIFYVLAEDATDDQFTVKADDEIWLRKIITGQQ